MARDIVHIRKKKILSFGVLASETTVFEGSCHILLYGGERPHIGCTVMAQPRPSLADPRKMSSTASVLNLSGHKDEMLCRCLAEAVSAGSGLVTVCTGGFHVDEIGAAQLAEVQDAAREMAREIWKEVIAAV